jgi:GTP-binding protein
MAKPVVAIVGRPNVGKSTFFNRCIGARTAIVDDQPGVTRDRIYREAEWAGHSFLLIDTGGLIPNSHEEMANQVTDQAGLAIQEADVIVFMVDGKSGLSGADEEVANILRKTKKPIILAVNKIDEPHEDNNRLEFFKLGLGEPMSLSAMRGSGGVGDLLDIVIGSFKQGAVSPVEETGGEEADKTPFSVAIVGRPNVGKSSIVNVLCGSKRSIVTAIPGTTRDAVDTLIRFHGREITLIDTAGIRRKSKVDYGIEAFSVVRSIAAIDRADVVVIMLDVNETIADQDQKIAAKINEAGKAVVIVYNKWDAIEDKSSRGMNKFIAEARQDLNHLGYAEVIFTSATFKTRVSKILEAAERAFAESRRRISTSILNQVMNEAVAITPPPAGKRGKRCKLYYTTQVSVAPPTFILFVNDAKLLTNSYQIYLERKIREAFGFVGSAVRIIARSKERDR